MEDGFSYARAKSSINIDLSSMSFDMRGKKGQAGLMYLYKGYKKRGDLIIQNLQAQQTAESRDGCSVIGLKHENGIC